VVSPSGPGGGKGAGNKGGNGGAGKKTPARGATPSRGSQAASAKRRKPASQPKIFLAAVLLIVIAGGAVLAYLAGRSKPPAATVVDPSLPPATAKGYVLGRPDAPVHIMEFADFECPACANYTVVTEPDVRKRVIDSGLAQVTYYDFPLPQHKNTLAASEAAACANDQGKFWEMHDRLFQGQGDWNTEATSSPEKVMKGYAKDIGLDVDKWQQCVDQHTHLRDIRANQAEGERHHVNETPTFVIGNRQIPGAITFDELHAYVDSARGAAPARSASK
jgi:protein-disulfide isomerase